MHTFKKYQKGFSAVAVVVILTIVVLIGVIGFMVYKNQCKKSTEDRPVASSEQQAMTDTKPAEKADEYAGWKRYTNTEYGFGYRYPANWTVRTESKLDPSRSSSRQEFAAGLKTTEERKYNDTVYVEILDQPFADTVKFYDDHYAQSSSNQISKTNGKLKGKDSVTYRVTSSGQESKMYLFSVGSKTYTFASINEEMNTQMDPSYGQTFGKIFNSFSIN